MSAPLTLHLIRHGEVHNPNGILYGRMPGFRLSAVGREQALAAGQHLAGRQLAAIYASPMQRAQETVGIVAGEQGHTVTVHSDERLNEVYTPYDGTSHAELEQIHFDLYTGSNAPYEQPRDVRRRVLDFIAEMREQHANQEIGAVSHGDIVVTTFLFAKGQGANDIGRSRTQPGRLEALGLPEAYPATACVLTLLYQTDNPDEVPDYHYVRPY